MRAAIALLVAGGLGVLLLSAARPELDAPRESVRLVRGPYLQRLTTSSVTVVWKTDAPARCSLAIHAAGQPESIVEGVAGSTCAVHVDGLDPSEAYTYVPRADGTGLTDESTFRTDDPGRPFTFLVLGDSGTGNAAQALLRDRMLATPADFILHTGDMVYPRGEASRYDPTVFEPYAPLLRRVVLWPCLGNHDVRTDLGKPWRDAFYTPANNPEHDETYYSFRSGNALFVILNSNASLAPGSPQSRFLDEALSASDATWKFVVFHHTIYSNGHHGSRGDIRDALVPLLDRHGVDLVLMGHDHDYERTVPLRGGEIVEPGNGTVYVTTGGGGQTLRKVGHSAFTADSESVFHFVRVTVDGPSLQLQMVRDDGTVGDDMRVTKPGSGPSGS